MYVEKGDPEGMGIDWKIRSQRKRESDIVFYCYKTNYLNYFIIFHDLGVRDSSRAQLGNPFALNNVI